MIVVKLELWPCGSEDDAREIGRAYIGNDGAGSVDRGDYKVAICRRGTTEVPREVYPPDYDASAQPFAARAGEVKDYPRLAYNVWRLIARAVLAVFPEEDRPAKKRSTIFDSLVARGFELLAVPLQSALKAGNKLPDDADGRSVQAALDWLDAAKKEES